ncbi:MAG: 30S ribosomal protein S9 [Candidatus Eisenbacteria bacterium]|uniref:Small ribosomal subunit protein uS9 n=1 Tax=Eiseniibacteriota bacterium TaxID=2212470 RepID=A0A933SBX4_UNCEI|nr:30S ribosomal protein S9 [Candidatus Eisenbacteria bacterium]
MATATTNKPLTGRRKEAVARVRLVAGTGNVKINDRTPLEYLKRDSLVLIALGALTATNLADKYDVTCRVMGGGHTGQAGAIRMAIARALVRQDETLKGVLGRGGYLTRDSRMKERKKYGQPGARKKFQFSKR